jgi:hypothetical protein
MNSGKINHFWWIAGAVILIWILAGHPDKDSLELVIILSVPLNVIIIYWMGDYAREREAYSNALHRIRDNEEKLAEERPKISNEPPPYRKADGKVWKLADAALTCKDEPDSEKYEAVTWERKRKVPWC